MALGSDAWVNKKAQLSLTTLRKASANVPLRTVQLMFVVSSYSTRFRFWDWGRRNPEETEI